MTDNPALSHLIHNKSINYTNTTHFIEPFHIITAFIPQIYKQIHHFQPPPNYHLTLFNPQPHGVRVSSPHKTTNPIHLPKAGKPSLHNSPNYELWIESSHPPILLYYITITTASLVLYTNCATIVTIVSHVDINFAPALGLNPYPLIRNTKSHSK